MKFFIILHCNPLYTCHLSDNRHHTASSILLTQSTLLLSHLLAFINHPLAPPPKKITRLDVLNFIKYANTLSSVLWALERYQVLRFYSVGLCLYTSLQGWRNCGSLWCVNQGEFLKSCNSPHQVTGELSTWRL